MCESFVSKSSSDRDLHFKRFFYIPKNQIETGTFWKYIQNTSVEVKLGDKPCDKSN